MVKTNEIKSGTITLNRNTFVNDKPANFTYPTPFSSSTTTPVVTLTSNYEDVEIISSSDSGFSYKSKAQIAPIIISTDTLNGGNQPNTSIINLNNTLAVSYSKADSTILYFRKSLDLNGLYWNSPISVLSATDSVYCSSIFIVNGNPAIAYGSFNNPYPLSYIRSNDIYGNTWGTPVSIETGGSRNVQLSVIQGIPVIAYVDASNSNVRYIRSDHINGDTWGTASIVVLPFEYSNGTGNNFLSVVNGNPAMICYINSAGNGLIYKKASNNTGSSWPTNPIIIADTLQDNISTNQKHSVVHTINGFPAITYGTSTGLNLIISDHVSGDTWNNLPIIIDSNGTANTCRGSIDIINNIPYISYNHPNTVKVSKADNIAGQYFYSTGTASQSGTTVTGVGTSFTSNMINGSIKFIQTTTGTASQAGTAVVGVGTAFTASMIGATILYSNGQRAVIATVTTGLNMTTTQSLTITPTTTFSIYFFGFITAVTNSTTLTISKTQTVSPAQAYTINYGVYTTTTLDANANISGNAGFLSTVITSNNEIGIQYQSSTSGSSLKFVKVRDSSVNINYIAIN